MIHMFKSSVISLRDHESTPLRIVGDGMVASHSVGDGRMLPVVILAASDRPDVSYYFALLEHSGSGDNRVQWGKHPKFPDTIILILTMLRPSELTILIAFELPKNHGCLVDQILHTKGLYLQLGKPGDLLSNTMDQPRILVEIAETNFQRDWEKIYYKFYVTRLRKMGLTRAKATQGAKEVIANMRKIGDIRLPSR